METMETVKFVALYALEAFVIALVGATVLAGIYQLVRDKIRLAQGSASKDRVPAPVTSQKSG
jgi:Na+-translocating ferredoxin:NAD+ oxidoreductase RnfG subunit